MQRIYRVFLLLALLALAATVSANYDDSPSCMRKVEQGFFSRTAVLQALSMHSSTVNQGQWDPIYNELQERSRNLHGLAKERANRLRPNPMEYPFNPAEVKKILLATLFDVFHQALLHNQVTSTDPEIRDMFNYIKEQSQGAMDSCFPSAGLSGQ